MEYVIGAVLISVTAYIFLLKRKIDHLNNLCLLGFQEWLIAYKSTEQPERTGMSRAFLLQTLHIAEKLGVLSKPDRNALEKEMRKEDPSRVVNDWLEVALPQVIKVGGPSVVSEVAARDIGLYMLICVMSISPERDLTQFFERLGRPLGYGDNNVAINTSDNAPTMRESTLKEVCPSCGQLEGLRLILGFPEDEDFAASGRGEVILGGSVVWDSNLNRQCLKCEHQWAISDES